MANNHSRDFIIIGRRARGRQSLEISDAPAVAYPLHEFSYKAAIEADFEIDVAKSSSFEPKRKCRDFAVTRHHRPNLSDWPAEINTFPAAARFRLNETAAAPFPGWKRELLDNGLRRIWKGEIPIPGTKV